MKKRWFAEFCEKKYGKPLTRTEMTLEYMRRYGQITPMDALEGSGCFRLSGRIFELRDQGYEIETIRNKKQGYATYILKEEENGEHND